MFGEETADHGVALGRKIAFSDNLRDLLVEIRPPNLSESLAGIIRMTTEGTIVVLIRHFLVVLISHCQRMVEGLGLRGLVRMKRKMGNLQKNNRSQKHCIPQYFSSQELQERYSCRGLIFNMW